MHQVPWFRTLALVSLIASAACSEDTSSGRKGDAGADQDGGDSSKNPNVQRDGGGDEPDDTVKLADNVAGKECKTNADCGGENAVCATSVGGFMGVGGTDTLGGYCTGECSANSDCGAGGVCSGGGALGAGSCRRACSSNSDCTRPGYHCVEGANLFVITLPDSCLPKPATVQLPNGIVGKPCTSNSDCGPGTCATTLGEVSAFGQSFGGRAAPGGYCTGDCLEDSECGANGVCATLPLVNEAGSCFLACGDACNRDGYHCGPALEFGGGGQGGGGGIPGGAGGIPGGQQVEIPNVCVPEEPEMDSGTPDGGVDDAGILDGGEDAGEDAGGDDAGDAA